MSAAVVLVVAPGRDSIAVVPTPAAASRDRISPAQRSSPTTAAASTLAPSRRSATPVLQTMPPVVTSTGST
jgi:hypothetical protein